MARAAVILGIGVRGKVSAITAGDPASCKAEFKKSQPKWARKLVYLDTDGRTRKRTNENFGKSEDA